MTIKLKFYNLFKVALIALFISIFGFANAYATTKNTKPLKFATEATYTPFVYTLPNGKIIGIETEIVQEICKKIDMECVFQNFPWDSLIAGIKIGKFDAIYGGMSISEERKKHVLFTDSLYTASNSIIFNKKANLNQDTEAFSKSNITVGILNGYILEDYIKETYPNIKIKSYESILNALQDLSNSRLDVVMANTAVLKNWNNKQPNDKYTVSKITINNKKYNELNTDKIAIALKLDQKELQQKINKAIKELKNDGTIDKILQDYF